MGLLAMLVLAADFTIPLEAAIGLAVAISGGMVWLVKTAISASNINAESIKSMHTEVVSLTSLAIRALTENTAALVALKEEVKNVSQD